MKYNFDKVEVKVELDEGMIEQILDDFSEDIEPYEMFSTRASCDLIIVEAFDMSSGDYRHLGEIDPSDYVIVSTID